MTLATINPPSEPLRWLFKAFFTDGTFLEQPHNDLSEKFDENSDYNPSAFSDLLEQLKTKELDTFGLFRVDSNEHVLLDWKTGNFVVNGVPVCAHNQFFEPQRYDRELVYFREKHEESNANYHVSEDGTPIYDKITSTRSYVNRYFIGWKTEVNGKTKQVTLAVG